MPAKAGIQQATLIRLIRAFWTSAFAGVTSWILLILAPAVDCPLGIRDFRRAIFIRKVRARTRVRVEARDTLSLLQGLKLSTRIIAVALCILRIRPCFLSLGFGFTKRGEKVAKEHHVEPRP